MTLKRRQLSALPLAPLIAHRLAWAQANPAAWPTRPVRVMVGFPGGSTPDTMTRTISDGLARLLGQPLVIDNRAGASGNIAAEAVARATDEHTLGVLINSNLTVARLINPATRFNPASDFAPISLLGTAPLVLSASLKASGNTPTELLRWAKALGRQGNYGTPGNGTVGHLGMELLKAKTGITAAHIPFAGNPQVAQALLRGDVHLSLLPPGIAMPLVKAGKLKAIGVTSPERSALVPELDTLREAGVPGTELEVWTALVAPASMPSAMVAKAAAAVAAVIRQPEVQAQLLAAGWQGVGSTPDELSRRMKADTALLSGIIAARRIRGDN